MNIQAPLERLNAADHNTERTRAVAIVDDDPHISQALGQWVALQGLRALYFSCAECLLRALAPSAAQLTDSSSSRDSTQCNVIAAVLDLNLPGMSGMALAHKLRALDADLPLVIVTALREHERRRYGQLPPGVRCLQKPFDLEALESALSPVRL